MPTLAEYAETLAIAFGRLEALGINLNRGRFRTYATTFQEIANLGADGDVAPDERLVHAAVCETIDLCSITNLPDECLARHANLIGHVADGAVLYSDAGPQDPGRETAFEFITASRFFSAGLQFELFNPSDVVVTAGDQIVYIECKRVKTLAALGRRLTEGFRQLSEIRRAGHEGLGVISVEISSIVNPDFLVLADRTLEAAQTALYVEVERVFVQAREHLRRSARNARQDAKVDVLLFRTQCFIRDFSERPSVCFTSWRAQPIVEIGSDRFNQMHQIIRQMPGFEEGIFMIDPAHLNRPDNTA